MFKVGQQVIVVDPSPVYAHLLGTVFTIDEILSTTRDAVERVKKLNRLSNDVEITFYDANQPFYVIADARFKNRHGDLVCDLFTNFELRAWYPKSDYSFNELIKNLDKPPLEV